MIVPYIELGKVINSENGKFMVVEGNALAHDTYYLIDIIKSELMGKSSNINSFRSYIGEITSITEIK